MKYKIRFLLSVILSICLSFVFTMFCVNMSGVQTEFNIDVEAGLLPDSQGSQLGGAQLVDVKLKEGAAQWRMEAHTILYVTWAKTDASNLVDANSFFVDQINEGGFADRWVYDTTLSFGTPCYTAKPFGLILTSYKFFKDMFVCDIGSSGSMPSYIPNITASHMSSGNDFTCSDTVAKQVKNLLTMYYTGTGSGEGLTDQKDVMPNTIDGLCAIYTMLYKYGGMPRADYLAALDYTKNGSGNTGYSVISSILGYPTDVVAVTYKGEPIDSLQVDICNCEDPANHDVSKSAFHRNWLPGMLSNNSSVRNINKTSYLLRRTVDDTKENKNGDKVTKFKTTWADTIPIYIKAMKQHISLPEYQNLFNASGYNEIPFFTTCFDMMRICGQNVNTEKEDNPLKFVKSSNYVEAKSDYWNSLNNLVPERNISYLPSMYPCTVAKRLEYKVGETPLDADGNPILDMNGNPITISSYNHYYKPDGTEYVAGEFVNGKQISSIGVIPSASALRIFNNNNRWAKVFRDSDGIIRYSVGENVTIGGVTDVKKLMFGDATNFYTGRDIMLCDYVQKFLQTYCVSPTRRAIGTNAYDTAYANCISYNDGSGNMMYHFGHSYLTTAGSGLRFDLSGYEKGQLVSLEEGESADFEPRYDIRLHTKSDKDVNAIDITHDYTMTISISSDKGVSIRTDLADRKSCTIKGIGGKVNFLTVNLSGSTLQNMFRTPEEPIATICANTIKVNYGKTITVPIAVSITIKDNVTGLSEKLNAVSYSKDPYPGFLSKTVNNTPWGTNYAGCSAGSISRVPWGQNSSYIPSAYAEIVANEIGNQDWNVFQGIPSTENLSISAGGDAFLVGYSGWTYRVGNACKKTYENKGVGEAMSSPGLVRKITINTTIKDIWGIVDTNVPCTLSCPTHAIDSKSTSTDPGAPGPLGEGASNNGKTANEFTCDICNGKFHYTWGGGADAQEATYDKKTGQQLTPYVPAVTGSWSGGHTCSASVTYNCKTGKFTKTGAIASGPDTDTTLNANKQRYTAQSSTWTCKGGATLSGSYINDTLIDEGYTTGYGCVCNQFNNHQHEYNSSDTFYVYEYVDAWYYRQLANVRLYGLSKSYVKTINTSVLNTGLNESAPCVGLKACIWRAGESSGRGGYQNGNGRIWFQQFSNPTYSSGTGWTTTIGGAGSGKTYDYWLGDCTVNISAYADRKAYLNQTLSNTDISVYNMSVRSNAGSADNHTGSISPTTSNNSWKTGKFATGDWLNADEIPGYHLKLVNTWQNKNNIGYMMTSISDTMALAVNDGYAENITGSVYNITNKGATVNLFNYPFTSGAKTHHRCFVNPLGDTLTVNGGGNVFQSSQPTMKIGYVGAVNQVTPTVGALYNTTLAYGLATASLTPEAYGGLGGTTSSSACYVGKIPLTDTSNSGHTSWELVNTGSSAAPKTFNGYWNTHSYPNTGSYNYEWKQNGNSVAGTAITTTNSGQGNLTKYNNQLVISNIDILGSAKNGYYIPCEVYNTYVPLADFVPDKSHPTLDLLERQTEYKAGFTGYNTNINNVIIHNPVSVQHCEVISNGAGAYASGVVDESGEDMRTSTAGVAEESKKDYVVIGNTIHIAYSDIGDFYSVNGTEMTGASPADSTGVGYTGSGCDPDTGVKSTGRGYVNNMLCSQWVKERYVKFPFPVSYKDKTDKLVVVPAEKYIPLSNVMGIGATGTRGYYDKGYATGDNVQGATITHGTNDLFHKMSNPTLDRFETGGRQYYYGLDYEFTCLTAAVEAQFAKIEFLTTSINDPDTTTNDNPLDHTNENHLPAKNGLNWAAESTVRKQVDVDIVGRIGNLTINDTGDFRFSNLFKATTSGYLIPGIVKNTDYKTPNSIVSTRLDILGNLVSNNLTPLRKVESTYKIPGLDIVTSHSTLSVSNYNGSLGKAGPFYEFPLTAGINNVLEFSNEQLRPGYDILMDVETMGNYYGVNYKDGAAYYGPTSMEELNSDTRTNVVTIVPHYYLYSPSLKKYVNIDIYSGVEGNRKLLWTNSLAISGNTVASLYSDLAKESYRRNVSDEEIAVTQTVLNSVDSSNLSFRVSADESDFIGTNSKIVLDAKNRTFVGSNMLYGNYVISGNQMQSSSGYSQTTSRVISLLYQESNPETLTDDTDFLMRSQRYHFTLGLPSSTYITECGLSNPNQNDIERSHDNLKAAYPDGVIVCMLEIYANDEVWELAYDENLAQGISGLTNEQSKVFLSSGNNLESTSDDIYLYRPGKGADYSGTNINPKWALAVVMDAWHTSAQDLETYGTH